MKEKHNKYQDLFCSNFQHLRTFYKNTMHCPIKRIHDILGVLLAPSSRANRDIIFQDKIGNSVQTNFTIRNKGETNHYI